jgi:cytochrome b561
MNPATRYHPVLVALHWFLAFFIIAALALGALVLAKLSNTDPMKIEALRSHMMGGLLILVLMLARLFVRTRTAHPAAATAGNRELDRLAWLSHRLLYIVAVALPVSGLLMAFQTDLPSIVFRGHGALPADFWAYPIRWVHYGLTRLLMALIALHILGALYHVLVLKDGLLRRMFFGRRTQPAPSMRAGKPSLSGTQS